MSRVWDENWFGSTKTLDVHIRWLRQKLGDDRRRPRFLHTVRGVGFRFTAPEECAVTLARAPAAGARYVLSGDSSRSRCRSCDQRARPRRRRGAAPRRARRPSLAADGRGRHAATSGRWWTAWPAVRGRVIVVTGDGRARRRLRRGTTARRRLRDRPEIAPALPRAPSRRAAAATTLDQEILATAVPCARGRDATWARARDPERRGGAPRREPRDRSAGAIGLLVLRSARRGRR
jgi:hypothetical protein